jgi:hypothetical protein
MAQAAINIKDIKKDFTAEMERRRKERQLQQDKSDVQELNRRAEAVREGKSRFYSEEEAETILTELGYHG